MRRLCHAADLSLATNMCAMWPSALTGLRRVRQPQRRQNLGPTDGKPLLDLKAQYCIGVKFHPDGRKVAIAHRFGSVTLWDAIQGGKLFDIPAHEYLVTCVAFSPDGTRLVTSGRKLRQPYGEIAIWHSVGQLVALAQTGRDWKTGRLLDGTPEHRNPWGKRGGAFGR